MPIEIRSGLYLSDGEMVATGRSLWEVEGGGALLQGIENPLDPFHVRLEVSPRVDGVAAPGLGVGREAMTEHRMRLGALRPQHRDCRWYGRGPEGEDVEPSGRGQQRRQCQERHQRGEHPTAPLPLEPLQHSRLPRVVPVIGTASSNGRHANQGAHPRSASPRSGLYDLTRTTEPRQGGTLSGDLSTPNQNCALVADKKSSSTRVRATARGDPANRTYRGSGAVAGPRSRSYAQPAPKLAGLELAADWLD